MHILSSNKAVRNADCYINAWASDYPSESFLWSAKTGEPLTSDGVRTSSVYGVVISGSVNIIRKTESSDGGIVSVGAGHAFSFYRGDASLQSRIKGTKVWIVERHGFRAPVNVAYIESQGRLSYIDGCSDSLLIYPPRKGDPSLNSLYFPPQVEQTFHTHPSTRLGLVVEGSGLACFIDKNGTLQERTLSSGDMFMLSAHERHRFLTKAKPMKIVAFHPDGDWGPEDHNHTMLNRTYLK